MNTEEQVERNLKILRMLLTFLQTYKDTSVKKTRGQPETSNQVVESDVLLSAEGTLFPDYLEERPDYSGFTDGASLSMTSSSITSSSRVSTSSGFSTSIQAAVPCDEDEYEDHHRPNKRQESSTGHANGSNRRQPGVLSTYPQTYGLPAGPSRQSCSSSSRQGGNSFQSCSSSSNRNLDEDEVDNDNNDVGSIAKRTRYSLNQCA